MKKIALLSIDVEDWYHLDYIDLKKSEISMLDGLDAFLELANKNNLKTTLFTLSDIVDSHSDILKGAIKSGHEIALHGTNHKRPLEMTIEEFRTDCIKGAKVIEENLSTKINGYRAACFSLDRQRLDILKNELGFLYDSSRIDFSDHPLYGSINMDGFYEKENYIYVADNFFEFEMPTEKFLSKKIPISGGGYLRILPWCLISSLVKKFISKNNIFSIYIHPFEMSQNTPPKIQGLSLANNFRFRHNIRQTPKKLQNLINLLKDNGFEFMTYAKARKYLKENRGK